MVFVVAVLTFSIVCTRAGDFGRVHNNIWVIKANGDVNNGASYMYGLAISPYTLGEALTQVLSCVSMLTASEYEDWCQ